MPDLTSTTMATAVVQARRRGARESVNQTGQQVARRNLNLQPTLTVRPGLSSIAT